MLSRNDADAVLAGLGGVHDRIAAAMYAVDQHPGLRLLRGGTLTGRTAERGRVLRPDVDLAWAHFSTLGDVLEQARAVRGRRRLDAAEWTELSRLLSEPVVAFGPDGLPVDAVTAGGGATRLSVQELAQQLDKRVAGVLAQLSEVEASWAAVASALAPVTVKVDGAIALAAELGAATSAQPLRAALAEAERLDLHDPLVAAPAGRLTDPVRSRLEGVGAAADQLRRELTDLIRLRDGYPQRRLALVALVDDLATAEQGVAAVQQRVAERIAAPGFAAVPTAAAILRARVPALDRLALDAHWRQLSDEMSTVESSAARARERAVELTRVAEGLLARRDELRGRLDAFRAKASARGLAEHDALSAGYTRAHDLLFTAPCDLRASTRAVHEYQQTLATVLGGPEVAARPQDHERSGADAVED